MKDGPMGRGHLGNCRGLCRIETWEGALYITLFINVNKIL